MAQEFSPDWLAQFSPSFIDPQSQRDHASLEEAIAETTAASSNDTPVPDAQQLVDDPPTFDNFHDFGVNLDDNFDDIFDFNGYSNDISNDSLVMIDRQSSAESTQLGGNTKFGAIQGPTEPAHSILPGSRTVGVDEAVAEQARNPTDQEDIEADDEQPRYPADQQGDEEAQTEDHSRDDKYMEQDERREMRRDVREYDDRNIGSEANGSRSELGAWNDAMSNAQQAKSWLTSNPLKPRLLQVRPDNDDVGTELPKASHHARTLFNAFSQPHPGPPVEWPEMRKPYYVTFQAKGMEAVRGILPSESGSRRAQANCFLAIETAISLHQGPGIPEASIACKLDCELKLSERILHMFNCMQIKRVAENIMLGDSNTVSQLAQNPRGLLTAKRHQIYSNAGKKLKNDAGAQVLSPKISKATKSTGRKSRSARHDLASNFEKLPQAQITPQTDQLPSSTISTSPMPLLNGGETRNKRRREPSENGVLSATPRPAKRHAGDPINITTGSRSNVITPVSYPPLSAYAPFAKPSQDHQAPNQYRQPQGFMPASQALEPPQQSFTPQQHHLQDQDPNRQYSSYGQIRPTPHVFGPGSQGASPSRRMLVSDEMYEAPPTVAPSFTTRSFPQHPAQGRQFDGNDTMGQGNLVPRVNSTPEQFLPQGRFDRFPLSNLNSRPEQARGPAPHQTLRPRDSVPPAQVPTPQGAQDQSDSPPDYSHEFWVWNRANFGN